MTITLKEAADNLSEIIHKGAKGEKIVLTDGDGATFEVTVKATAQKKELRERVFGSGKGSIKIGPNFNDPIPGMEPYMS